MKKFIILSIIFIMASISVTAETTVPIPSCACNNIASQLNDGQNVDRQIQKEIKQMDKDANNLNKKETGQTNPQKHKWFWQR